MEWDNPDTDTANNPDGHAYTHEVNDGVIRYRTIAPRRSLKTVALAFTEDYDDGDGDPAIPIVAAVTHLRTGREAWFAFWPDGRFEWHTTRRISTL